MLRAMRTLIITGGTGGLGSEVVPRLQRDYRCVLLTREDLADEASVNRAVENAAPFYGLVHLVGGFAAGSVAETSIATWSQMIKGNLEVAFLVVRAALKSMQRPGRIVAIGSAASVEKPAGIAAYTVAKSALNTLIEVAAAETRGSGITVNALLPTALDTPAMRGEMDRARLVPLARVAESIAFLLSDDAASITGALIPLRP